MDGRSDFDYVIEVQGPIPAILKLRVQNQNPKKLKGTKRISEHARDAFGPYFTGASKKTWTFTRMVTHDQLNHSNVRQHVTTITQMISDDPSILYPDVREDDEDDDDADANYSA
ncbi:hypothetical protein M9H77_25343 [Catharanthus roseus]|uniref:Uncharacterized protein n=1 Tax=Catharanthus roseus TaxID=4058 RepID=A0ACC0A828_CATRO|nr:hypothetical protein M9H77_25343 [Catharanthus roseus]